MPGMRTSSVGARRRAVILNAPHASKGKQPRGGHEGGQTCAPFHSTSQDKTARTGRFCCGAASRSTKASFARWLFSWPSRRHQRQSRQQARRSCATPRVNREKPACSTRRHSHPHGPRERLSADEGGEHHDARPFRCPPQPPGTGRRSAPTRSRGLPKHRSGSV